MKRFLYNFYLISSLPCSNKFCLKLNYLKKKNVLKKELCAKKKYDEKKLKFEIKDLRKKLYVQKLCSKQNPKIFWTVFVLYTYIYICTLERDGQECCSGPLTTPRSFDFYHEMDPNPYIKKICRYISSYLLFYSNLFVILQKSNMDRLSHSINGLCIQIIFYILVLILKMFYYGLNIWIHDCGIACQSKMYWMQCGDVAHVMQKTEAHAIPY